MMQEAFDQHMKENGGQIVNIVTTNRTGMAGLSHTGAARAGVKVIFKVLINFMNQIISHCHNQWEQNG